MWIFSLLVYISLPVAVGHPDQCPLLVLKTGRVDRRRRGGSRGSRPGRRRSPSFHLVTAASAPDGQHEHCWTPSHAQCLCTCELSKTNTPLIPVQYVPFSSFLDCRWQFIKCVFHMLCISSWTTRWISSYHSISSQQQIPQHMKWQDVQLTTYMCAFLNITTQ